MSVSDERLTETVTLSQAKALIRALAAEHSLLLLSPPGVGKSDAVAQAATEAGLPCRSLLGTQIAPEDVSGVPRIVGERSVFCPPRVLLPEDPQPFCLFLDELPACAPDIQKAFYALLLERRLGEHPLPAGTWVVAAGNRAADRALVRSLSSALVNRVIVVHVRVDLPEWLAWAADNGIRSDIRRFLELMPEALMRPVPMTPVPFSTPRSWASLSRALDRAEGAGILTNSLRRALAFGRVTAQDAAAYCAFAEGLPTAASDPEADSSIHPDDLARQQLAEAMRLHEEGHREESITLSQAKALIRCMADDQSLLLLSAPGVGKSEAVAQAATEAGLPCRSLLGTQIAPEDVSGVPRIVGERSVFCPPRVLLPEDPQPFCLFLDELPACAPDIQKAFYALLLERRLGEHPLPPGTWVVAAGNRAADRALVRSLSSALVNRVFIVQVRVDVKEWLAWAQKNRVRPDVIGFVAFMPESLMRAVPAEPVPFSTPRAWTSFARALDRVEQAGILTSAVRRALAFGRLSPEDAAIYCTMAEEFITGLRPMEDYLNDPEQLPDDDTARWFVFCRIRTLVQRRELTGVSAEVINNFLRAVPVEHRFALMVDLVDAWGELGATPALRETLREVTGV